VNCMTFRGNARIFSIQTRSWTAILGRREYTSSTNFQLQQDLTTKQLFPDIC
jgi:hypothetical protein